MKLSLLLHTRPYVLNPYILKYLRGRAALYNPVSFLLFLRPRIISLILYEIDTTHIYIYIDFLIFIQGNRKNIFFLSRAF